MTEGRRHGATTAAVARATALGLAALLALPLPRPAAGTAAIAPPTAPSAALPLDTDRLVVRLRPGARAEDLADRTWRALGVARDTARLHALGAVPTAVAGATLVMRLPAPVDARAAADTARRVADDPRVVWAEPDVRVRPAQAAGAFRSPPGDPLAAQQWGHGDRPAAPSPGSARLFPAWPLATGGGIVVAVLDTGSRPHPDMAGRWLPGRDFVSDLSAAADGDGRDADPTDPGDACGTATTPSWHGLRIAGVIGAVTDNGLGIAGGAPSASLLPLRVMGRCGGWMSDIADAVRWAAGLPVAGQPANPTPARVINLSLGSASGAACPQVMQEAVDAARARGAVVIAAAGNEGLDALGAPASCRGVVAVGAHTRDGDLAAYANRAAGLTGVALTGPGGGACASGAAGCRGDGIPVLDDGGGTAWAGGTSVATAHVSAAAALVLSLRPSLGPDEVRALLRSSAQPHLSGSVCAGPSQPCGSGRLDALAALRALGADLPPLTVTVARPSAAVRPLSSVSLTAIVTGGLPPHAVRWQLLSGSPARFSPASTATVDLVAPAAKRPGDMPEAEFELSVTDAAGTVVRDVVPLHVDNPPGVVPPGTVVAPCALCPVTVRLGGVDPDGDALRHRMLDVPGAFEVDDAAGTVVLRAPAGDHRVRYVVEADGLESPEASFVLRVPPASAASTPAAAGTDAGLPDAPTASSPAPAPVASPQPLPVAPLPVTPPVPDPAPAPGPAPAPPPPVAAAPAGAGGGGGGALGGTAPLLLMLAAAALRRRGGRDRTLDAGRRLTAGAGLAYRPDDADADPHAP